jgi:hypothetical protein
MGKASVPAVANKQNLAIFSGCILQNSENSETTICQVNALMGKLD